MTDDLSAFRVPALAKALDQLGQLLSQSNLAFLIGAGCSKCAGLPLMAELTEDVRKSDRLGDKTRSILKAVGKAFDGAKAATIEDFLSEIVDDLAIADRRGKLGARKAEVDLDGITCKVEDLRTAIGEIKDAIATRIGEPNGIDISTHDRFVRTVHATLRSGKSRRPSPVDYVVLNYDDLIEDALGLARIPSVDGFVGGVTGWWNLKSYEDVSAEARVLKPHGSVDWFQTDTDTRPQRLRHGLYLGPNPLQHVMIWPAATKYRETQNDPYAQILDLIRRKLRPEGNQELVLVVMGYSFGDSHINHEITEALHASGKSLTVVAFVSGNGPEGIVSEWRNDMSIRDQVRVHAKRGFFHGDTVVQTKVDLPWWRFEVLTRLLGGDR